MEEDKKVIDSVLEFMSKKGNEAGELKTMWYNHVLTTIEKLDGRIDDLEKELLKAKYEAFEELVKLKDEFRKEIKEVKEKLCEDVKDVEDKFCSNLHDVEDNKILPIRDKVVKISALIGIVGTIITLVFGWLFKAKIIVFLTKLFSL